MNPTQISALEAEYLRRAAADEAEGNSLNASTWRLAAALLVTPANLPPLPPNTRYGGRLKQQSGTVYGWVHGVDGIDFWIGPCQWSYAPDPTKDVSADWHVALPLEAVRDEPAKDEPASDHRDCNGGCLYGHETGGWPNRVCPHGECLQNERFPDEDEPAKEPASGEDSDTFQCPQCDSTCYASDDIAPTGVEARVCEDIAARQRLGIAKYGCTVEQSKDDMLRHAYEGALDLAVYLKAELERRQP